MKNRRAIGGEWLRNTPFLSESTDVEVIDEKVYKIAEIRAGE
jgi:hypothetical protein